MLGSELGLETYEFNTRNKISAVAANAFLLWDILLTSETEINLVWRSRWSFPKVLYLITRYLGLINLTLNSFVSFSPAMTPKLCRLWQHYNILSTTWFFSTAVNLIFLLRLWALFSHSTKVIRFLYAIYSASAVLTLIPAILTLTTLKDVFFELSVYNYNGYYDLSSSCFTLRFKTITTIWLRAPSLVLVCLFFFLTIYRLLDVYRDDNGNMSLSKFLRQESMMPLMTSFVHDGVIFFTLIFVVSVITMVYEVSHSFLVIQINFGSVLQPWYTAIFAVSGSRLILHLRKVSLKEWTRRPEIQLSRLPGSVVTPDFQAEPHHNMIRGIGGGESEDHAETGIDLDNKFSL